MNSRKLGPSPADLQNHLYTSFLEGSTADVALRVHGSWDAIYKLHRVVLIQSGFFRSLFTAGFAESTPRIGSGTGLDEIVIRFDDPNITRAARLYGGGPPLDIDPSLIPTLSKPLTPSFPHEPPLHKVPADHHPATPRFLLSLLATTVYLSIPFLASQALSSILSTVGPHTVLNYLNFALGGHTGLLDRDSGEPEAAVGLESVAQIIEYEPSMLDVSSIRDNSVLEHHIKEDPADLQASTSSMSYDYSEDYETEGATKSPSYHYGALSDKIGEACACWLARWGADILSLEEKQMDAASHEERNASFTRRRSKTVPSGSTSNTATERQEEFHVPVIWSRGGLNARWVSAVISADTFFIRGERERYDFARRVIELRRKRGIVPTEEEEWINLFKQGIYYANMFADFLTLSNQSMDDIIYVSQDVSPTTKKVFVPLSTIQAAHWMQSILRHQITARPVSHRQPSVSAPSALPREKELGVTQTTADILMTATTSADDSKTLYQVPVNSSVRIGDNGNDYNGTLEGGTLSMDQLFFSSPSLSPPPSSPTLKPNPVTAPQVTPVTEKDFFGLHPPVFTTSSAIASDSRGKFQWSTYPPYRFAVEFWDLESLKEKSRLYSRTIWYAGSLFNTYIQVVRKKGQVQLGIYLHRQSSIEPIPPSSAPSPSTTSTPSEALPSLDNAVVVTHNRGPSLPSLFPPLTHTTSHYSPSIYPSSRSMSPRSSGRLSTSPSSSPSSSLPTSLSASTTTSTSSTPTPQLPATAAPVTPPQPYRDPRASISAYFVISCASATGSSQTRFSSSPDVFSVGQSWGWKSSSLRTEEFMDVQVDGSTSNSETSPNKDSSLRATIVLGLV
ncbi:hypothetical protein H0H87_010224 [Tephrocybe sp. NHM501043]|nr:hypothetical protein H0H87_010224 [Tephrocybe sp. NHM501043]